MNAESQVFSGTPEATVYLSNVEEALSPGRPISGDLATKVQEISSRGVWYDHEVTVLPTKPDQDFLDYAADMGVHTQVVVPETLDYTQLTMRDGLKDPAVRAVIRDHTVESYIGDPALYTLVSEQGGVYGNGDPKDTIDFVNDKANYKDLVAGVIEVPPGVLAHGIDAIAQAVQQRLAHEGGAFVRHTHSGGGFGNRLFNEKDASLDLDEIKARLGGGHPELWHNGSALIEQRLDLRSSPGVAYRAGEDKIAYDFYQITSDTSYVGNWTPLPAEICDPAILQRVGRHLATKLGHLGFYGMADTDLGITSDNQTVGFEINGRRNGVLHTVRAGELLHGPWNEWRDNNVVSKAVDHFYLRTPTTFRTMHDTLAAHKLLASPESPYGTIITVPPAADVAGVQVLGRDYEQTETMYQQVLHTVGDPQRQQEDYPLFSNGHAAPNRT